MTIDAKSASREEVLREPDFSRKIRFWKYQWIGLPLLFAIPVLALCGVFGMRKESVRNVAGPLEVTVEYPERFRYREGEALRVRLKNNGGETLRGLRVHIDPEYLERFSRQQFSPVVKRAYEMEIPDLPAGAVENASVELEANDYGRHNGSVQVSGPGIRLRLPVSTFVFP